MAKPHSKKYSVDELIEGMKSRVGIDFVLPKLPEYVPESILGLGVNPKAHPGVSTSRLIASKRGRTTPITKRSAYDLVKKVILPGVKLIDRSLLYVGGREKRNIAELTDHCKELKSRCVIGYEDVPTLIGQSVVKPINESLQRLEKGFNWGGRINGRQNFMKLVDELDIHKNKRKDEIDFGTDFEQHDNNVSEEQNIVTFAALRLCYPEGEEMDNLFYYLLSGIVLKRIVLPESNLIYEITKGIASGHAFTSISTTVNAFLTLSTAMNKVLPSCELKRTRLQGAGDD